MEYIKSTISLFPLALMSRYHNTKTDSASGQLLLINTFGFDISNRELRAGRGPVAANDAVSQCDSVPPDL